MTSKYVRPILIIIAVALVIGGLLWQNRSDNSKNLTTTNITLTNNNGSKQDYKLEKVTSSADQTRGLGGRSGLAANAGMVFAYPDTTQRCIWMKDMKFNIDVVWFDGNNRITSIVPDMTPASYPQSYCAEAKNVIEFPAGTVARQGLRVGQIVEF